MIVKHHIEEHIIYICYNVTLSHLIAAQDIATVKKMKI